MSRHTYEDKTDTRDIEKRSWEGANNVLQRPTPPKGSGQNSNGGKDKK